MLVTSLVFQSPIGPYVDSTLLLVVVLIQSSTTFRRPLERPLLLTGTQSGTGRLHTKSNKNDDINSNFIFLPPYLKTCDDDLSHLLRNLKLLLVFFSINSSSSLAADKAAGVVAAAEAAAAAWTSSSTIITITTVTTAPATIIQPSLVRPSPTLDEEELSSAYFLILPPCMPVSPGGTRASSWYGADAMVHVSFAALPLLAVLPLLLLQTLLKTEGK